ncbi:MAG TPA: hypothetical protein VN821_07055 [Candidatus Udaeobacter sp.]|nr:hypothetical protein [Candidatus Udaeobacter sp.]
MWGMGKSSINLFFHGRLFADPKLVLRQLAVGIVATAILLTVVAKLGAPLWLAALLAGFLGGALQPYLFKDLRYR